MFSYSFHRIFHIWCFLAFGKSHAWHPELPYYSCSCMANWPRQGLWMIGKEMMDNGLNFTDFENPMQSPVMSMVNFDNSVLREASMAMQRLSRDMNIDMDIVMMSLMKQIKINGEPMKKTVEDMTYMLAKVIGSPAHAKFYKQTMASWENIFEQYEELIDAEEPDYRKMR